jgi:hypothetical protein
MASLEAMDRKDRPLISHTKAILLMEKLDVKDYTSQIMVIVMVTLLSLGLILYVISQGSVDPESEFFVWPHTKWSENDNETDIQGPGDYY